MCTVSTKAQMSPSSTTSGGKQDMRHVLESSFLVVSVATIKCSHQALCDVVQAQVRGINELKTRLTESERHERQQQLQRTMTLLVHASACDNQACPSTNCNKVKALFKHAVACQQKVQGGCHLCRSPPPPHFCSVSLSTLGCCASYSYDAAQVGCIMTLYNRELNLLTHCFTHCCCLNSLCLHSSLYDTV